MSFPFELVLNSEYETLKVSKEKIIIYTKHQQLSQLIEYADLLRSIEDVIVETTLTEDDTSYTILEYILNNTTLKSLEIRFSRQIDDERSLIKQMQLVANYLSANKSLQRLILSDDTTQSCLNHQTAEILAQGINGSNLEFLGLIYTCDSTTTMFFNILSTNTRLQRLILRGTRSSGSVIKNDGLFGSNLRQLQISHMDKGCNGIILSIINILRNSTKLELFELKQFSRPDNFFEICDTIAANRSLKTLIIESHHMENTEDIQRVLSAVKCHPTIDSFEIGGIWCEGLKLIADLLDNKNSILRSLTINKPKKNTKGAEVKIDLADMTYFTEKLATNTTLKYLFLGKYYLNGLVLNYPNLLNALISNTTLTTLDLHPKSIIHSIRIPTLLHYNKTLTTLAVRDIYVPDLTKFYAAIMQNESLTSLDISRMTYEESEEKVFQFITDILVNKTTLKELKCSRIRASRKKVDLLTIENTLPSLKYNHTLTGLDLFAKPKEITESELKTIADVFSTNKTLVKFNAEVVQRREIEPYLRRNREYSVDAVILGHNIVRAEEQVLPSEVWRLIFQQVSIFSLAMKQQKSTSSK